MNWCFQLSPQTQFVFYLATNVDKQTESQYFHYNTYKDTDKSTQQLSGNHSNKMSANLFKCTPTRRRWAQILFEMRLWTLGRFIEKPVKFMLMRHAIHHTHTRRLCRFNDIQRKRKKPKTPIQQWKCVSAKSAWVIWVSMCVSMCELLPLNMLIHDCLEPFAKLVNLNQAPKDSRSHTYTHERH